MHHNHKTHTIFNSQETLNLYVCTDFLMHANIYVHMQIRPAAMVVPTISATVKYHEKVLWYQAVQIIKY